MKTRKERLTVEGSELLPVHPDNWDLLGTCWAGLYFVELRFPFGGRSSTYIFNSLADTFTWILQHAVDKLLHYLDDFFTCGAAGSNECAHNLRTIIDSFERLGVQLAMDKVIGQVSILVYMGTEINNIDQTIRLPEEKFQELLAELKFWQQQKKCTKRNLLSLIGKLSFAAKVVHSGRIFLAVLLA